MMVLEPNEIVGKVLDYRLRHAGLEVTLCLDYEAALPTAKSLHPDLILIEPKAERGMETLAALRRAFPHLPILVLTVYLDEMMLAQAEAVGATDCLLKQLDWCDLLRRIEAAMKQPLPFNCEARGG